MPRSLQAGRDVVACLNEAMERQGLDMRVSALVCCAHSSILHDKLSGLMKYSFYYKFMPIRLMILWEL